jgi:hypothetical protein
MEVTDPYMSTDVIKARLLKEYHAHPRLIIGLDFDDTVFDFHQVGSTHEVVIHLLRQCKDLGFYIVLFTASAPERHEYMRVYMKAWGIEPDSINKNPIPLPYGHHGKIFYNILLDDRAGLGQAVEALTWLVDKIDNGL